MMVTIAASIIRLNTTLIIEIILFLIFLALLNRLFYQPIAGVIRERAERVEAGLHAAEESRLRAEETQQEVRRQLQQARAEAQGIIAAAVKEAGAQRQQWVEESRQQADALIQQAQDEIQRERQAAVDELRRGAGQVAILAASKVVGRSLDTATNRDLADRTVAEVGGIR